MWLNTPTRDLVGTQMPKEAFAQLWRQNPGSNEYNTKMLEVANESYTFGAEIGRGGFGRVLMASRRTKSGGQKHDAVVKIQAYSKMALNTHTKEPKEINFLRMLSAQSSHISPQFYDAWVKKEEVYIVMERLDGKDLRKHVQSVKMRNENMDNIIFQLYNIINLLTSLGLHHGDLKGENLVWTGSKLSLIDFGSMYRETSKMETCPPRHATQILAGPEYKKSNYGKPTSKSNDIYSFGHVVYLLCAGRYIFEERSDATNGANYEQIVDALPTTAQKYKSLLLGTLEPYLHRRFTLRKVEKWITANTKFIERRPSSSKMMPVLRGTTTQGRLAEFSSDTVSPPRQRHLTWCLCCVFSMCLLFLSFLL